MCPRPEYLRLCRLLEDSLHPFSDFATCSITEEHEKDLLIVLSEILRQVKQWTQEIDPLSYFDTDEELLAKSVDEREPSGSEVLYLDNRHCLARIIGDLMSLLAVNSRFAQHLLGNTLVAIAEFVITSESGWDDFINLLCLCLELAIRNTLSSSSHHAALGKSYLVHDSSVSKSFLELKLKDANWLVVAAILCVLRVIMKNTKRDNDEKFVKVYLDCVGSLILNIPWNLLSNINIDEGHKASASNVSLLVKVVQPSEMTVFYGNLIQFLCSTVGQSSTLEAGVDFSIVIHKICHLVPELVSWCHAKFRSPHHVRIYHYFRHKVLMLMIKLSSHFHVDDTILLSWLHILHKFFEDLLLRPLRGAEADEDSSLEGSPFCSSLLDAKKQNKSSRHLQRLTVFIFLRCSLNLVESPKGYFTSEQKLDPKCCTKSEGLVQLHKWLQAHVPADIYLCQELYFQRCVRFTFSFLKLFMHEDDILFKMLLQLFRVPFFLDRQTVGSEDFSEVKNDLVYLVSDLFNPAYLFHLFLAEILYDHQVLLDYLISNDTGSSCAEYLLRSLRIVCDSWNLFIEFPGVEEDLDNINSKKRKFSVDELDFSEVTPSTESNNGVISSLEKNGGKGNTYSSKRCRNYRLPFVAAKGCLLSLRTSIDSLNQKNLFPYNPEVLLRRLMRFEELCNKE